MTDASDKNAFLKVRSDLVAKGLSDESEWKVSSFIKENFNITDSLSFAGKIERRGAFSEAIRARAPSVAIESDKEQH